MGTRTPSKRRRRPPRPVLMVVVAGLAVAATWAAGLVGFAGSLPSEVADGNTRTDAIVVLTGGSGRLGAGLELLSQGRAEKMFVSGVYRGVDVRQLLEISQRSPEELACCIEPGHGAVNTAGNAAETAAWMRRQGFDSLRIVTASYHMPRSLLEFRRVLREETLIPHPVFPAHVRQDRWWAFPGTAALIVGEYNKYLLAWLRHLGDRVFGGS